MGDALFRVVKGRIDEVEAQALDRVFRCLIAEARASGQPQRGERGRWGRPSPEGPGTMLYNPSAFHTTEYY